MILLDTHTLLWWVSDQKKLSSKARKSIQEGLKTDGIYISAISIWEIALLLKKGKLTISMEIDPWFDLVETSPGLHIISLDATIARKSVFLYEFIHNDPADRMIITTAKIHNALLITKDQKIRKFLGAGALW